MGNVFFNTDVDKTVDINKLVNLNVTKDVFANVDISGRLATAEASADAIGGGGGGGGGEPIEFQFIIDTFDTFQEVLQTGIGTNTGSVANFVTTDIPAVASREAIVEQLAGIGDSVAEADDPAGSSRGRFSSEDDASADFEFNYTSSVGAFSIVPDDPSFDIADCVLFIDNVTNDLGLLPGGGSTGFTPAVFTFEDSAGNISFNSVELGAIVNQDIAAVLTEWLFPQGTPGGAPAQGTVLAPGVVQGEADVDADGNGVDGVDFENIVRITIDVPINDFFPGATATDISVDDIFILCEGETPQRGGDLAETDTFAQVTDAGAFSFSEALAASSNAEVDMLFG